MKTKKIINALSAAGVFCATLASYNTLAASTQYTFGFSTVADVAVTELTELNFGGKLTLQAGSVCTLKVTGTFVPSPTTAKLATGSITAHADYAKLDGIDCGVSAGTLGIPGIFEIDGAGGVDVEVTLTSQNAGTNFNFVPTGVGVTYDGASNGDTFVALTQGTAATLKLAKFADLTGNATGTGVPSIGKALFFVGGAITVTQTLLAGTEYTETYGVDVVYK